MAKILSPVEVLGNLKGYQIEVLLSKAKVRVLLNSRQSGKTSVLRAIIYKEALESKKDILVFAVTHRQVKYNLWKVLFEGQESIFPSHLIKSINRTDMYVELINGSTIRCSGLENVDAVLGATADTAIFDEAQSLSEDAINKVQPVLSTRNGRMILAGTVRTRTNILWKYYEKGTLGHPDYTPGFRSWRITVHDSPTPNNNPQMIEFLKSSMSRQQFASEFLCDPDTGVGRVVPDFDSLLNRSDKQIDPNKGLIIGCDYNVSPMTAVIYQQFGNEIHAVDEIYLEDSNTQKMSTVIVNKYSKWKGRIRVYPDASGSARRTSSDSTDHEIMRKAGLSVITKKANPLIIDRYNTFNYMVCDANENRRLFVHPKCTHLVNSLLGLTYDSNGKPDKSSDLEHIVDAASYPIYHLYNISTRGGMMQMHSDE